MLEDGGQYLKKGARDRKQNHTKRRSARQLLFDSPASLPLASIRSH